MAKTLDGCSHQSLLHRLLPQTIIMQLDGCKAFNVSVGLYHAAASTSAGDCYTWGGTKNTNSTKNTNNTSLFLPIMATHIREGAIVWVVAADFRPAGDQCGQLGRSRRHAGSSRSRGAMGDGGVAQVHHHLHLDPNPH